MSNSRKNLTDGTTLNCQATFCAGKGAEYTSLLALHSTARQRFAQGRVQSTPHFWHHLQQPGNVLRRVQQKNAIPTYTLSNSYFCNFFNKNILIINPGGDDLIIKLIVSDECCEVRIGKAS